MSAVRIFVVIGLLALPLAALAQETDAPAVTLADVLQRAQRDPPAVLVAHAEYQRARAERAYAEGEWIPKLTGQATASYVYDNQALLPSLPRVGTHSLEGRADLQLEWALLDVARGERIDAAEAAERASAYETAASRARAAVLAAELYVRAGAAVELTKDAALSLERRREQYAATAQLVTAGTRSPVDVQRAKIEVLSAEYIASIRRTEELAAYAALGSALGLPADRLVRPATSTAEFSVTATSLEHARQLAAANRPELRAAAAGVTAAQREYDAALGERWPTLGAAASGTVAYVDVQRGLGVDGDRLAGTAGVYLRWTGLDPAVWMKGRVTEESATVAERQRASASHAIDAEAVAAFYVLERARVEHRRAVAVLEAAQVTREAQNGRYLAGLGSLLELLDTEDLEQEARQRRIEAQRDEAIAAAQLQSACGLLVR